MENVWVKPEGYQRTATTLQREYLRILLSDKEIEGAVLDVGCGTANTLDVIDQSRLTKYTGVDISPQMIDLARSRFPQFSDSFVVSDFLHYEDDSHILYDHVVCTACLHWFYPNHLSVVKKIRSMIKPGGLLHLSCAYQFDFLSGEGQAQREALRTIRSKFSPIAPADTFDTRRASIETVTEMVNGFEVQSIARYEKRLEFGSFEDFRDWHIGSGSVVMAQFSLEERGAATEEYYKLLYKEANSGNYPVCYSTVLMTLSRDFGREGRSIT